MHICLKTIVLKRNQLIQVVSSHNFWIACRFLFTFMTWNKKIRGSGYQQRDHESSIARQEASNELPQRTNTKMHTPKWSKELKMAGTYQGTNWEMRLAWSRKLVCGWTGKFWEKWAKRLHHPWESSVKPTHECCVKWAEILIIFTQNGFLTQPCQRSSYRIALSSLHWNSC